MDSKFWNTTRWACLILALLAIVFLVLIPFILQLYFPIFWPDRNIDSLASYIQNAGIIVSFFSLALAIISIFQANSSGKDMRKALESLNDLKVGQEIIKSAFMEQETITHGQSGKKLSWTLKTDDASE